MIHTLAQYRAGVVEAYRLEQSCSVASKPRHLFQLMAALVEFEQGFQATQSLLPRSAGQPWRIR